MREVIGFWAAMMFLLVVISMCSGEAECYDGGCGGECTAYYDCRSGCDCYFPENDDNEHYGRCA